MSESASVHWDAKDYLVPREDGVIAVYICDSCRQLLMVDASGRPLHSDPVCWDPGDEPPVFIANEIVLSIAGQLSCDETVHPFRAQCVLPKGHDGEHRMVRP